MKMIYYFLPVLCGIALSVQAIINGQLRLAIGSPVVAALISFLTGTVLLLLVIFLTKQPIPSGSTLASVPWPKWTGGLLGAFFVTAVIISIQRIPSAHMFALIITSQFITALVIDHYGWLGAVQNAVTPVKLAGVFLLILGAYFIIRK